MKIFSKIRKFIFGNSQVEFLGVATMDNGRKCAIYKSIDKDTGRILSIFENQLGGGKFYYNIDAYEKDKQTLVQN